MVWRAPGTVRTAKNSRGQTVQLQPESLTAPYDISHKHSAFETEYASGQVNGFDRVASGCNQANVPRLRRPRVRLRPEVRGRAVFRYGERYAFASNMFETNEGPSFPAHQYLLSGTSTIADGSALRAAENPHTPSGTVTGGCDSPTGSLVTLIDQYGHEDQSTYPCFQRNSLIQLIKAQSLTWHYYQAWGRPMARARCDRTDSNSPRFRPTSSRRRRGCSPMSTRESWPTSFG